MKKTFKTMLALMAGAMTFTGCTSDILENTPEQIPSALKPMTFTATQEGDATRAAISGTAINWTEGDKISIFDGVADEKGNYAHEFTIKEGDEGKTYGTFTGEADPTATTYYALYPYVESVYKETEEKREVTDEDLNKNFYNKNQRELSRLKEEYEYALEDDPGYAEYILENQLNSMRGYNSLSAEDQAIVVAYIKGEEVVYKKTTKSGVQRDGDNFTNVVLPSEQTVAEGQYVDPKAMLMIAKSTDASTLEFKNVCAFVKVTPKFDCDAICLYSKGGEQLAGTLTVNYNNGEPTTTVTENGSNEVFLTGTITHENTYYIAVRPETLTSGFTIEFLTADADKKHYYARTSSKDLGLARNKVTNLGEFATTGTWSVQSPTSGDDGNLHSWKLVSGDPVLKLATDFQAINIAFPSINRNAWGDKWAYPVPGDFDGVLIPSAPYNTWIKAKVGLLKKNGIEYSKQPNVYCGEPDANNQIARFTFWGYSYTPAVEDNKSGDVVYKYVGE